VVGILSRACVRCLARHAWKRMREAAGAIKHQSFVTREHSSGATAGEIIPLHHPWIRDSDLHRVGVVGEVDHAMRSLADGCRPPTAGGEPGTVHARHTTRLFTRTAARAASTRRRRRGA